VRYGFMSKTPKHKKKDYRIIDEMSPTDIVKLSKGEVKEVEY
jgi:hypothetical protein